MDKLSLSLADVDVECDGYGSYSESRGLLDTLLSDVGVAIRIVISIGLAGCVVIETVPFPSVGR